MSEVKIYIGTSGWNYDHWDGNFYPADLPKTKRFEFYSEQFSCIEVNATFYRSFKESTYKKWKNQAPQGFKYILKVPRFISHRKYLDEAGEDSVKHFTGNVKILESNLGGVLLQIGRNTDPDPGRLKKLLQMFGSSINVAVEFRNDEWFNDDILNVLKETGAIFCDTDSPEYSLKGIVTTDKVYLRLHGKNEWYKYDYPNTELGKIAKKVEDLKKGKAKEIFIFFNNDYKGYAPENAHKLKEFLEKEN